MDEAKWWWLMFFIMEEVIIKIVATVDSIRPTYSHRILIFLICEGPC